MKDFFRASYPFLNAFAGAPILKPSGRGEGLRWDNLTAGFGDQREHLDFIRSVNGEQDPLVAELRNRELAFRMQSVAPEIMELERESQATRDLYGIGANHTDEFGRTLLLARRFSEASEYAQITKTGPGKNAWCFLVLFVDRLPG